MEESIFEFQKHFSCSEVYQGMNELYENFSIEI